ncbi:hypothetical protein BUE80_DR005467 [Diplocarpon rosae]|nr:hypothetical protein BUE80_DR005467 [Diplocarpon rosae]
MRAAYFSLALLSSLAASVSASCTTFKVGCDSSAGCQKGVDEYKCAPPATLDGNALAAPMFSKEWEGTMVD